MKEAAIIASEDMDIIHEEAWREEWGPSGHPTPDSPYGPAAEGRYVLDPEKQKDRALRTEPKTMTMSALLAPCGGNTVAGLQLFRNTHPFAVWRVMVPDFLEHGDEDAVKIIAPKSGYHCVIGVHMLSSVRKYLVCLINTSMLL